MDGNKVFLISDVLLWNEYKINQEVKCELQAT